MTHIKNKKTKKASITSTVAKTIFLMPIHECISHK